MDELASLQESAREMALERFRIIQPHLEHDRSLSLIARTTNIPYRTIHRWLTRYRRFGLAALARKAREDRRKRRTLSPRLMQLAEALALEVPPLLRCGIFSWGIIPSNATPPTPIMDQVEGSGTGSSDL